MKKNKVGKSQKGIKGTVGAPLKEVIYPKTKTGFTVGKVVELNNFDSCELTIRKAIKRDLKSGKLVEGEPLKKKDGEFGRRSRTYILKEVLKSKTVQVLNEEVPNKDVNVQAVDLQEVTSPVVSESNQAA